MGKDKPIPSVLSPLQLASARAFVADAPVPPEVAPAEPEREAEALPPEAPTPRKRAKTSAPDRSRVTLYLLTRTHDQLRVAAAKGRVDMSDIAEQAISGWLKAHR